MTSLEAQLDVFSKKEREDAIKDLRSAFDARLKPHAFKRDGLTWRLLTPDAVCVTNIQKSVGGNQVYVNLGILLRWVEDTQNPKEYNCHFRARIETLSPPDLGSQLVAVPYADLINKTERFSLLIDALEQFAIPAMLSMRTREAHHKALRDYEISPIGSQGSWPLAQPAVMQKFRELKS